MNPGDVQVGEVKLRVVADDHGAAFTVLRAAEEAVPAALDGMAEELGDEVLLIRNLELAVAVLLSGTGISVEQLRDALRAMLKPMVQRARQHARQAAPGTTSHVELARASGEASVAWYPSEAAAISDYLRALVDGGVATKWPQRAFSHYGHDWNAVLSACVQRGRTLVGDVLAEIARSGMAARLSHRVDATVTGALVGLWTGTAAAGAATFWEALPAEVRELVVRRTLEDVRQAAASGSRGGESDESARAGVSEGGLQSFAAILERGGVHLLALAHLFAAWPPARGLRFDREELKAVLEAELTGRPRSVQARRLVSNAGGLVFWSVVFEDVGLHGALDESFPAERVRRAVRWAVSRGLENASLSTRDPILLLWAGERPDASAFPMLDLKGADPEPLHRLALQAARRLGHLNAELRVVPFGGGLAVMAQQGLIVDALPDAKDGHDAIPEIVRRLVARTGAAPAGIEVGDRLRTEDLDAISEIDVPAAPDSWRPALWACTSLVRAVAGQRWRAQVRDVRGWPAVVVGEDGLELARTHVDAVASGSWLQPVVRLGASQYRIVVV